MNIFENDLKFSHEAEDMDMWKRIYAQAFPNYKAMANSRENGQLQYLGIDRTVITESGKAIYIDEKVRRKDYGDIALEYISNDKKNSKGWVEKPLFCDFIAYAILPTETCYLLPVIQLQSAWIKNKELWLTKYGTASAPNKYYKTLNCPVPIQTLFSAIGQTLRINYAVKEAA